MRNPKGKRNVNDSMTKKFILTKKKNKMKMWYHFSLSYTDPKAKILLARQVLLKKAPGYYFTKLYKNLSLSRQFYFHMCKIIIKKVFHNCTIYDTKILEKLKIGNW